MKKRVFAIVFAASLCLLAAAGCSAGMEQNEQDVPPLSAEEDPSDELPEVPADTPESGEDAPEPDAEVTADLSKEPPFLRVTYGSEVLDIEGWNWTWTVQAPDGTSQTLEPEWAMPYPLDWVDLMDTLVRSDTDTLSLSFAVEPDSLTAYADILSGEADGGPVPVENGAELSLLEDAQEAVYTIHAEWNGSSGYQGDSYYAFCVKTE